MGFRDLDRAANRAAQLFRDRGLATGDTVALWLDNRVDYYALAWGAQRSGLRFVCISTRLTAEEVDYLLEDSGAKLLVADASLSKVASALSRHIDRFALGGAIVGYASWEEAQARKSDLPVRDETAGSVMLYSSGTTGRPKGVVRHQKVASTIDAATPAMTIARNYFGMDSDTVYLSTAPLYHSAPLSFSMAVHQLGGTVVLMAKFDPLAALSAIDRYSCTAGQFVPTHFVRMLKLTEEERASFDGRTLRTAIHAAAPCPIPVKRAMIAWWGPILDEYYAGTESNGVTAIRSSEWLDHEGSVGRPIGGATLHICDENDHEVPPRTEGTVFFESEQGFHYHGDPEKTAQSRNRHGWTTLGDVGWVDENGYLYLTDRKSFMIISGGVNIYPQEIENLLVTHSKVADVAVIGAPHDDMGEQVIAVVQTVDAEDAGEALAAELMALCRKHLSGIKVPRRFDFLAELPRQETGKLFKRILRDTYWPEQRSSEQAASITSG